VLTTNSDSFLTLAQQSLGKYQEAAKGDLEKRQQAIQELVTPLQTKIRDFEQKVDEVYRTEAAERNSLRGEIKNLVELNQQISKEASNLAMALKGDTKKQGNWGELILEKVLEFSGLRKGDEYKLQVSQQDEDGRRQQPDAIIYLPENKHIIVDAKVSLIAYDRFVSAQTEEERSLALLEHIASVKNHIKLLSDKKYQTLPDLDSPDFTLLFMPIESSFGLAVQADNELFAYAWDRKIVIVSPSTLLATLRTISSIWKQERQTKNALEIADRAGKMYDKFVGFVDDLVSVGKKMDEAKTAYGGAMNKLSSGTGNLVRQSEQLKEMGAKATKQLPGTLLDRAGEPPLAE
jgi:DNA recombination protein RmuC